MIHVNTTHLPTMEGWKAELAWLADPLWAVYTTIDRVQGRESSPVRDQYCNH